MISHPGKVPTPPTAYRPIHGIPIFHLPSPISAAQDGQ